MNNTISYLRADTGTYVLIDNGHVWSDALKSATQAIGIDSTGQKSTGTLLTISSSIEQTTVVNWLLDVHSQAGAWATADDGGGIPYVWLGASDLAVEGIWEWANGEAFAYANWGNGKLWDGSGASSEPDDYQGQDALAMGMTSWPQGYIGSNGLGGAGQWNDIDDKNVLPFVLEFSADVIRFNTESRNFALDLDGNAGIAAKILGAVFGKASIANKEYVGIGLDLLDSGMSYEALAGLALSAAQATTNDQIVTRLWTNIVGSDPTANDKAPFIKMLEDGVSAGALTQMAADSSFNTDNINLVGLAQTGIEFTPVG
jgi:hypothetical protein